MKTLSPKTAPVPNQINPGAYEKTLLLTYRWRCDSFPKGIPASLQEALDESAENRAFEMRAQGFREGELIDNVHLKIKGTKTPDDGFYCKGWFEFIETTQNTALITALEGLVTDYDRSEEARLRRLNLPGPGLAAPEPKWIRQARVALAQARSPQ